MIAHQRVRKNKISNLAPNQLTDHVVELPVNAQINATAAVLNSNLDEAVKVPRHAGQLVTGQHEVDVIGVVKIFEDFADDGAEGGVARDINRKKQSEVGHDPTTKRAQQLPFRLSSSI